MKNKAVLVRIIEVFKVIGDHSLSIRDKNNKTAYSLNDPILGHDNFLEMVILLLRKYDTVLNDHLNKIVNRNEKVPRARKFCYSFKSLFNYCLYINRFINKSQKP